jgi:hypothetical protein
MLIFAPERFEKYEKQFTYSRFAHHPRTVARRFFFKF